MGHQVSQDLNIGILRPGTSDQSPPFADLGVSCCHLCNSYNLFLAPSFSRWSLDLRREWAQSRQTALAKACSQPSPFLNGSGPSLVRKDDIHPPYQRSFYATVSWSEAATPTESARSRWLLAGSTLGKLSEQSRYGHQNKHPWFSLSPSLRQNWTEASSAALKNIRCRGCRSPLW